MTSMRTMDLPNNTTNGAMGHQQGGAGNGMNMTMMNQGGSANPGSMMMGMWAGQRQPGAMMPMAQVQAQHRASTGDASQDSSVGQQQPPNFAAFPGGGYSNNPNASILETARRNSLLGAPPPQDEDESINYLAARAHAAQMLAAEESRRLEENLMRLEMRRMMMGKQQQQQGGANANTNNTNATNATASGQQAQGGAHGQGMGQGGSNSKQGREANAQEQARLISNGSEHSNSRPPSSQGTKPPTTDADSALLARAQQFNNMNTTYQQQLQQKQQQQQQQPQAHQAPQGMNPVMAAMMGGRFPHANFNWGALMYQQAQAAAAHQQQQAQAEQAMSEEEAAPPPPPAAKAAKKEDEKPAPRRPLSAYNIFFSEVRETMMQEKEDEGKDEGEAATPEANGDRRASEADGSVASADPDKSSKPKTDKCMTAFTQTLMKKRLEKKTTKRVHRKGHGKVAFTTLAKTVGAKWRAMSEEDKKKYRELADMDRARYRREKAALSGKAPKGRPKTAEGA